MNNRIFGNKLQPESAFVYRSCGVAGITYVKSRASSRAAVWRRASGQSLTWPGLAWLGLAWPGWLAGWLAGWPAAASVVWSGRPGLASPRLAWPGQTSSLDETATHIFGYVLFKSARYMNPSNTRLCFGNKHTNCIHLVGFHENP